MSLFCDKFEQMFRSWCPIYELVVQFQCEQLPSVLSTTRIRLGTRAVNWAPRHGGRGSLGERLSVRVSYLLSRIPPMTLCRLGVLFTLFVFSFLLNVAPIPCRAASSEPRAWNSFDEVSALELLYKVDCHLRERKRINTNKNTRDDSFCCYGVACRTQKTA